MGSSVSNSRELTGVPDADEVRRELERILASPVFRGSKRCQDFLHYVVTKVLEGEAKSLKERTLAIEVFGRNAAEDLTDVSIVRVGAREVRKRLAQYYVEEGENDAVRIGLPPGSYVAVFQYHGTGTETGLIPELNLPHTVPTQTQSVQPLKPSIAFPRRRVLLLISVALAVVALSAAFWRTIHSVRNEFDSFWQPIFEQKGSVEILLAHPIVYHPSSHATGLDEQINGRPKLPLQRAIRVPDNLLNGSDFVPVIDQYVGFGDTVAALRITNLVVQRRGMTRVRLANKVEFNDLVGSNVVLIGAFTNRWTTELMRNFRFRFDYVDHKPCLEDSRTSRRWPLATKKDNGQSAEDYILVCRLPHPQTNGFVVVCAGLNVYGTEEGGRILAEPGSLIPILKKLPAGWVNRNLELILHVEVIGEAPALPELVAAHSW